MSNRHSHREKTKLDRSNKSHYTFDREREREGATHSGHTTKCASKYTSRTLSTFKLLQHLQHQHTTATSWHQLHNHLVELAEVQALCTLARTRLMLPGACTNCTDMLLLLLAAAV